MWIGNILVVPLKKNGVAADVVERLKMFNGISTLFSRTNYLTANMCFYKICEIKSNIKD